MQLQLFEANLFELFFLVEIRFLEQFLQSLSVTMMFCVETIDLCAQRTVLYFIHQAPPLYERTFTYISPTLQLASGKIAPEVDGLWISGQKPTCVIEITSCEQTNQLAHTTISHAAEELGL